MMRAQVVKKVAVAAAVFCLGTIPLPAAVRTTGPAGGGLPHDNHQPGLGINYIISTSGIFPSRNSIDGPDIVPSDVEPFIGEITMFAGNFAPRGWQFTDGQLLPVASNAALFSLLGTVYGGDGRTTFALPDLRSRSTMHFGSGPGLTPRFLGQELGYDSVTLTENQMPAHHHALNPPLGTNTITMDTGGTQPHANMKPSLGINYYMPLAGVFPSRNDVENPDPLSGGDEYLGSVRMAGYNFAPRGNAHADGQLLDINQNTALFSILGTTYGGDGRTNFALPDLRGRLAVHEGQGPGLSPRALGERGGAEQVTVTQSEMPAHSHPGPDPVDDAGGNDAHENVQPFNTLNYIIATEGIFPSRNSDLGNIQRNGANPFLGEIHLFAGNFAPRGWAFADGQLLDINQNTALFSILGTTYGGDGRTSFALPDLRGRVPVHVGGGGSAPGLRDWSLNERFGQETVTLTLNELPSHTHEYIPEPSSAALGIVGLFGVLACRGRRRR